MQPRHTKKNIGGFTRMQSERDRFGWRKPDVEKHLDIRMFILSSFLVKIRIIHLFIAWLRTSDYYQLYDGGQRCA